jgi:putative transposase
VEYKDTVKKGYNCAWQIHCHIVFPVKYRKALLDEGVIERIRDSDRQIAQIFKSITAREIFSRKPLIKKELWGGKFWTDSYCVATVGERADWATIERYIKRQNKPQEELVQLKLL